MTDVALAVLLIQSYINKHQGTTDRMAMAQLDAKIREDRNNASPTALALGSMVLLMFGTIDKANDFSERAYKSDPFHIEVLLARGWCVLASREISQNPGKSIIIILKKFKINIFKYNIMGIQYAIAGHLMYSNGLFYIKNILAQLFPCQ